MNKFDLDGFRKFKATAIKPAFNCNTIIDNLTGEWAIGPQGEYYLVGGYFHRSAIGGDGNVGKTQMALQVYGRAMNRYYLAQGQVLDSEDTMPASRIENVSEEILEGTPFTVEEKSADADSLLETDRCMLIDLKTELRIDKWFDMTLAGAEAYNKEALKNPKKYFLTYPWLQDDGKHPEGLPPTLVLVDSWSEADVTSANDKSTADGVDSSKGNTEWMREGAIKGRILSKSPALQHKGGIFMLMTAAYGDKQQDMAGKPGQPPKKAMTDLIGGKDFKRVSSQFKRMTHDIWVFDTPKVFSDDKKMPQYPMNKNDMFAGNADLRTVSIFNARGKGGSGSGVRHELVQSQTYGLLEDLSNYHYLTTHPSCTDKSFGQDGATSQFRTLHLYPELKFQRTDIRRKLIEDRKFAKAVELTASMKLQFFSVRNRLALKYQCTPQELYDDLIALGYDWDILLDTDSYWLYNEWVEGSTRKNYLSILDLLRMRQQLYIPYWYPHKDKLKVKLRTEKQDDVE